MALANWALEQPTFLGEGSIQHIGAVNRDKTYGSGIGNDSLGTSVTVVRPTSDLAKQYADLCYMRELPYIADIESCSKFLDEFTKLKGSLVACRSANSDTLTHTHAHSHTWNLMLGIR